MKKTLLTLLALLSLTLIIFAMTTTVSAAEPISGECGAYGGNLTWSFDADNGTLTISGEGEMATYYNSNMYGYGGPWYDYRNEITNIVINEGVTSIGSNAFLGLTNIKEIDIPDSVLTIGEYAFEGCTGLRRVDIGDGVQHISYYAFKECWNIYSLTLGQSLGQGYTFPVESGAFDDCHLLVEIYDLAPACLVQRSDADPIGHSSITVKTDASIESNIVKDERGFVFYVSEEDGYYFLLDYEGTETDIVLPEYINGNQYTIRSYAFYKRQGLNSVKIPDTVKAIQRDAFVDSSLVDPDTQGVQYVDKWLIRCPSSNTVCTIRDDTVGISDQAFLECNVLEEITIPDSVRMVGNQAFENCHSLIAVNIGSGVRRVGTWAFRNCRNLMRVEGAAGVRSFGHECFNECVSLEAVFITDLANWCTISFDNGGSANPMYYAGDLYLNDILITTLEIPDTVTEISAEAFRGATCLQRVHIYDNVTEIGKMAFAGCDNISYLTIPFVGKNAEDTNNKFGYLFGTSQDNSAVPTSLTNIDIVGATQLPESAFMGIGSLRFVTLSDKLTTVSESAFGGCHSLIRVVIPESVTKIEMYAFTGCPKLVEIQNLSSLEFGKGSTADGSIALYARNIFKDNSDTKIKFVDDYIFYYDVENNEYILLAYTGTDTEITLPAIIDGKVYSISNYAFANCKQLVSVTIPSGVKYVGDNAFNNCPALISISFPNSIEYVGSNVLGGENFEYTVYDNALYIGDATNPYTILVSAVSQDIHICDIHPSTKVIYDSAFFQCENLTYIEIPEGVKSINYNAFAHTSITKITIPASVNNISESAFGYCESLKEVTILTHDVTLGSSIFSECLAIETLNVPANVLQPIAKGADFSLVTRITINHGEILPDNLFHGFPILKTVWLPDTVTEVGHNLFESDEYIDYVIDNGVYYLGSLNNNRMILIKAADKSAKEIEIDPQTKFIYDKAFEGMYDLKKITIPDSVVVIGASAFAYCTSLTEVTMGKGVERIESFAFSGCTSLTNVRVPDGIKYIGESAFTSGWNNTNTTVVYCGGDFSAVTAYESIVVSQHYYYYLYDDSCHNSKCYYCWIETAETPHVFDEGTCLLEPTHLAMGVMEYACTCGYTKREDIPMISHEWDEGYISVYPTHTSEGTKLYYCGCGEYKTEIIEKLEGHIWNEGYETQSPTHMTDGVRTYSCACGETYTEPIPKLADDHTWDNPVVTKEATHLEYGSTIYTCECGQTSEVTIPKLEAHEWDEGTVTTEATHFSTGVKTYTCGCGETTTEELAMLEEHVFGEWQSISENQHSRYCNCGEYEYEDHVYGDDGRTCSVCAYQKEIPTTEKHTEVITEEVKPSQPETFDKDPDGNNGTGSNGGCGASVSGISVLIVSLLAGIISIIDKKKNRR